MTAEKDMRLMKNKWDCHSCIERACQYVREWEQDNSDAWPLICCAFELRLALESFLLTRFENVTGTKPKPKRQYQNPAKLTEEMLKSDPEAMTEQVWHIIPSTADGQAIAPGTRLEYRVLDRKSATDYLGRLGDFLHATVKYQKGALFHHFWLEKYQLLTEILHEMQSVLSAPLTRPVTFRLSKDDPEASTD